VASILSPQSMDIDAVTTAQLQARNDEELGKFVMRWWEDLRGRRMIWDRLWQEVRELIRPNAEDFTKKMPAAISRKLRIYRDLPSQCLHNLAAGIQSNLTNAADRWFALSTGDERLDRRPEVALWLDRESDAIYDDIYHWRAGFNYASHELYLDWAGFGTAILNFLEDDKRVHFRAIPLAECCISDNDYGIVDVVFRKFELSKRAAIQRFGDALPPEVLKGEGKEDLIAFVHGVYPIESEIEWQSVYVHESSGKVVDKGMFREFPYCVLRWTKMAGDVYGRSPGTDTLQTVRVLYEAVRLMLQSSQIAAAPPIITEDDGVLSTAVLQPWAQWRIRPGSQFPKALELPKGISITQEMIKELCEEVKTAFFNDVFEGTDYGNRDRVTGQEVQVDQASKLRRMSGITGRAEIEFLGPLIMRVGEFRKRTGKMAPMPMSMQGRKIKINYLSPASQALRGIKAQNTLKFLETVVPFLQYDPQLLDGIDLDKVMMSAGFAYGIDRDCVRTDQATVALRKQRANQQQAQAQTQQAVDGSQAALNIANARKADPSLGGLIQQ
jgi:hypothetical protein